MKNEEVTTIQLTSKKLKMHKLISIVLLIVGSIIVLTNVSNPENEGVLTGVLLMFTGMVALIITRIRIWWNHK